VQSPDASPEVQLPAQKTTESKVRKRRLDGFFHWCHSCCFINQLRILHSLPNLANSVVFHKLESSHILIEICSGIYFNDIL
jgi:hypothetical protein